jgi:hypothetical protein
MAIILKLVYGLLTSGDINFPIYHRANSLKKTRVMSPFSIQTYISCLGWREEEEIQQ